MELQAYLRILNHYKMLILFETMAVVVAVAFGTSRMTRIYSSSTLLRIAQPTSDVVSNSDLDYTERLIETYIQILKSRPFLEETNKRLVLSMQPSGLASLIKVEAVPSTELIRISVESPNPNQASAIANMLAQLLIEQGQKVYTGEGKDARQILLDQLTAVDQQLSEDRVNLALAGSATPESPEASSLAAKIHAQAADTSGIRMEQDPAIVV